MSRIRLVIFVSDDYRALFDFFLIRIVSIDPNNNSIVIWGPTEELTVSYFFHMSKLMICNNSISYVKSSCKSLHELLQGEAYLRVCSLILQL